MIRLEQIREAALRAGRAAKMLMRATEADVVAVRDGVVWRGKPAGPASDDAVARFIASSDDDLWVADTHLDPMWRDHPGAQGPSGVRFCATAVIRLRDGRKFGVLRVFDVTPRAYDSELAGGLRDIAALIAEACDGLLSVDATRMRELFDQAPGFMCMLRGPDHVHELVNSAYLALVGDRDLIGRTVRDALPEIAAQGAVADLDQVFRSGEPYRSRKTRLRVQRTPGRRGEIVYIDVIYQPIRGATGEVVGIVVQGHDVTTELLAAGQLKASEVQLAAALSATQTILDQSLDVICTADADGRFTMVSKRAEEVWGYRPDELVGRLSSDFLHPEDLTKTLAMRASIQSGTPTNSFSNRYIHKDGSTVPMMWASVWSEQHRLVFAIARDMREHIEAETRLRQAQKLEALGRLTAGIAHDFNNLLGVIIGSVETLADGIADRPDLQPAASLALDGAQRGADLIKQLLGFARNQPFAPQAVSCTALLDSLVPMLHRTIGEDIELLVDAPAEPLYCLADGSQLTSALLNICINARDAMPDGGRLSVTAYREGSDVVDAGHAPKTGQIVLKVTDTGHGMSKETIARVMEPFFTTKPVGKGTGLGLSMVYGFVRQSGGRVETESEIGRGTAISIYLPEALQAGGSQAGAEPVSTHGGRTHVLLVEDDDLVVRQVQNQLELLNYQVSTCCDAREALERLAKSNSIRLLLTDVVMPGGMNGCDLAKQARELYPRLSIVLTSGYADEAVASVVDALKNVAFLPKPYRRADLARTLATAIAHA